MKVLVSDKLSESGLKIFQEAGGIEVINEPGLGKDIDRLKEVIKDVDAIAIRSGTTLTEDILQHAKKLKVIGRAGIGVDNVDLEAASKKGIIVMNTPFGNTVTTAEHAISMMCALTRMIPQATASVKAGKWEKSRFMGAELTNKTLGLVGCGNIGKIVASRAIGLKMKVSAFDPFLTDEMAEQIGVTKVDFETLLEQADYITLHVPKNEKTSHLINKDAFSKMKKGVFIINCARGGIVNESDLAVAIEEGIVAGAALDVFEKEPVDPDSPLLKMDQVICTPHLGAATEEAQENVAVDVARQIADFLKNGTIQNAVNFPSVSGEMMQKLKPYIQLAEKIGALQGQLSESAPEEVKIDFCGEMSELPTAPLVVAVLRGLLKAILGDEEVNSVNATLLAKERGLKVIESKRGESEDFSSLLTVSLKYKDREELVAGSMFGKVHPRLVRVGEFYLEAVPDGSILVIHNEDQPGVVGNVGTLLSKNGINISRMQLGLSRKNNKALALYNIEGDISDSIISELKNISGILSVKHVVL